MVYFELHAPHISTSKSLQVEIANDLCAMFNVNKYDEIYVAQSAQLGCDEIKPGCLLCYGIVEIYPQFGEQISVAKPFLYCIRLKHTFLILHPFETYLSYTASV